MVIDPAQEQKINTRIKKFIYLNCPFLVGTSILVYTPLLKMMFVAEKADTISKLLTLADFLLFFDSYMIFSLVTKVVTSIVFKPQTNKIEITYLGQFLFKPKTEELDPK